jgi:uncharacterized protein YggL (DUF469 family)
MKKRLRKKKHLKEFAEYGIKLIVYRNTKENDISFHDDFIINAIEKNKCYCGGFLYDDKIDVIVELGRKPTHEDKIYKITKWNKERPDISSWEFGDMIDIWYGNCE